LGPVVATLGDGVGEGLDARALVIVDVVDERATGLLDEHPTSPTASEMAEKVRRKRTERAFHLGRRQDHLSTEGGSIRFCSG